MGEQQWEREDLETSSYKRHGTESGERAEERKVCGCRSIGDHRAQSRKEGFEQRGEAGIRDVG